MSPHNPETSRPEIPVEATKMNYLVDLYRQDPDQGVSAEQASQATAEEFDRLVRDSFDSQFWIRHSTGKVERRSAGQLAENIIARLIGDVRVPTYDRKGRAIPGQDEPFFDTVEVTVDDADQLDKIDIRAKLHATGQWIDIQMTATTDPETWERKVQAIAAQNEKRRRQDPQAHNILLVPFRSVREVLTSAELRNPRNEAMVTRHFVSGLLGALRQDPTHTDTFAALWHRLEPGIRAQAAASGRRH